jgi:formate hydrogenlyase subunit 3/multisubunit Na+/H+ antiporter MnhD subunit
MGIEKYTVEILNLIALLSVFVFPFLSTKKLALVSFSTLTFQVVLSSFLVYRIFSTGAVQYSYAGSLISGTINFNIDYLSAWMLLLISFTFFTGAWYGLHYMKKYKEQTGNLKMHATAFILAYTALIDICMVQNTLIFLVVWEIMALSSFMLIIFEHYNKETLRAGINFLIQSHISILFLTMAFIWAKIETGSFDFASISVFTSMNHRVGMGLFALLFIGFAIKAGFVPFHTWLPLAHPAAPSHVSGIMSGVIVKIGIFGILRMVTVIHTNYTTIGFLIIILSIVTGLYGVIMAIVQNNLKRLLAYSTIENIGIIGLGIGLGCLGKGTNHPLLLVAGFGGALLHALNHSLFKSLLFFNAGNVYQATHLMNMDSLGGLIKKIPRTAYLFLIGSLAICGFPPFNGFVSEFYIYNGLFTGFYSNQSLFNLTMLFSIFALVLIGGLALISFTKAFGIVFLGKSREHLHVDETIDNKKGVLPLYLIVSAMLAIGLFPFLISNLLLKTAGLFYSVPETFSLDYMSKTLSNTWVIGLYSIGFIAITTLIFYVRKLITKNRPLTNYETWGCSYTAPVEKAQYTGGSYVRTFGDLFGFVVNERKSFPKISKMNLYPTRRKFSSQYIDIWEKYLILPPLKWLSFFLNYFKFIQNGKIQSYVVYGLLFILIVVIFSMVSNINLGV